MISNYIKIAWRNLIRHKLYSFINIAGLAAGLAVCMMIMLYVAHEMSYDRFHKNANRIFSAHYITMGDNVIFDEVKYDAGEELKRTQPAVEDYLGVKNYYGSVIVSNPLLLAKKLAEEKLIFADARFFNFFSFNLLSGSADNVLKSPFSVVLSKDMAAKYFGNQNPIGKTITLKTDSTYTYKVTGVAENCPSNSSIQFNFVVSTSSLRSMKEFKEENSGSTYLLLKHTANTAKLIRSVQLADKKKDAGVKFGLISLPDTHLTDMFSGRSNFGYLKIFPLIAGLILLLALVNYMSLSTARATLRAKEIGVRKVNGAGRKTLAVQFYIESALFVCLSFILGYVLYYIFKPWFLNVLQLKIDNSFLYSLPVLVLMFGLLILTILLAGSYPALMLSAFKPVSILKGKIGKTGGVMLRKVFTIIQFTIAVVLIICGIVIDRQLYFFRHTNTGIDRDNVLIVPFTHTIDKGYDPFKQDIQSLSGVSDVAASKYSIFASNYFLMVNDHPLGKNGLLLNELNVDTHFIPLLNLKWKSKPDEHIDIANKNQILINEKAIERLKLKPDPVGAQIESGGEKYTIAGVLKNFNSVSLANEIAPLAVAVSRDNADMWNSSDCSLYVKIKAYTNLPTLIDKIGSIYKKYDHETPFSYSFMDDEFNKQYNAEDTLAAIFSLFTCVAVILATLGLFGLAAFTIEQRIKEIGIRKVLGASTASINLLLSVDFLKLVLLSIIIASPIAWWAMHKWLQSFAYRITVPWWVFIMAGFIAIITSIITVGYNATKATLANPVESLRSE